MLSRAPHSFESNYPAANGGPQRGIARMSTLGVNGRFGNQLFQYAYPRSFAAENNLSVECSGWVGESLFGHRNPVTSRPLPVRCEPVHDMPELVRFDPTKDAAGDIELWGYFHSPRYWSTRRELFRSLFKPQPAFHAALQPAVERLCAGGRPLVGIHIRRGDFTGGPYFWPAPHEWYVAWLAQIWPKLHNPVLYIATDDPAAVLPHFAAFNPVTDKQLGVRLKGAEYYADFFALTQCHALAISNSSFSYAAAMLNERCQLFARPDPAGERLELFDVWNSDVLLRDEKHAERSLGSAPLARVA